MVKIQSKKQLKKNTGINLLSNRFRVDINSIRLNTGNTLSHELAKTKLAYLMIKEKKEVITEAIFKGGGRADIYIPKELRVYEILHSEKEKEALLKREYYPKELDIIFLKAEEINGDDYEF